MKNLEHLPEKFAFKLDDLGKRWIRETFGKNYDDVPLDYFNFDQEIGFNSCHLDSNIKKGYTLISTDQLFPPQTIPTIEKGVKMLVWNHNEKDAVERDVMFFDGNFYHTKTIGSIYLSGYKNAKPIPQLPEYTIEEAQEIFKFKVKQ